MSYEDIQNRLSGFCEETEVSSSDGSGSDHEIDNVSERSFESDTEQELDSDEQSEEIDSEGSFLLGKNGTKWFTVPNKTNIRNSSESIARGKQGVRPVTQNAKTAGECWNLFITHDILQEIVIHTNFQINIRRATYHSNRKNIVTDITLSELKAFIGLLYLAGRFKSNHINNLKDLWRSDGSGIEIFRSAMTLRRFQFIHNCLRFDDKATRQERKKIDNLALIRSIFEKFVACCQSTYSPSEYMTIDEQLLSFRGRCSFRQYMPNKPSKYGLKIYALADSISYYVVNLEICPGKQPPGPYSLSNKAMDVVDRLVAPISKTNRNVTFDNWFTSYPLMLHLLNEHRLTSIGTVRKNKAEIPKKMLEKHNRDIPSNMFGFQKDISLVSHVPKKNKVVLIMSTLHHNDKIDPASLEKQTPEMITFYNQTKGGVDAVDQLCTNYDVSRNTKRWPMVIFYAVLNIAGINSMIIYKANNNSSVKQRDFIRDLGIELISEHLRNRKENLHLPTELRKRIRLQEGESSKEPPQKVFKTIKRCEICPNKKDRKTKYFCYQCYRYLCMEHAIFVCENCTRSDD